MISILSPCSSGPAESSHIRIFSPSPLPHAGHQTLTSSALDLSCYPPVHFPYHSQNVHRKCKSNHIMVFPSSFFHNLSPASLSSLCFFTPTSSSTAQEYWMVFGLRWILLPLSLLEFGKLFPVPSPICPICTSTLTKQKQLTLHLSGHSFFESKDWVCVLDLCLLHLLVKNLAHDRCGVAEHK